MRPVEAFERALSKNRSAPADRKLGEIGTVHYNLGIAYFQLQRFDAAKRAMTNARGFPDLRKGAESWLARIGEEQA